MGRYINNDSDMSQTAGTTQTTGIRIAHQSGFSYQPTWTDDTSSFSNKTFDTGVAEVATITWLDKASTTDGDYVIVYDQAGTAWAVATDATGSSAEPTGALWVAIAAANKGQADISADTSAADVAARFETAFNALSGFTALVTTDDTAADGTMTFTQTVVGTTTNPIPKDEDDGTAGTIAIAETTGGVDEEVSTSGETVSIPAHGYITDLKVQLTTTGTLPAGLSTSTDYYIINASSSTVSFAAAAGGSAINITDTGTGVHTVAVEGTVAGTITVQGSNDNENWVNTATASTISAASTSLLNVADANYQYVRLQVVMTEGASTVTSKFFAKE